MTITDDSKKMVCKQHHRILLNVELSLNKSELSVTNLVSKLLI